MSTKIGSKLLGVILIGIIVIVSASVMNNGHLFDSGKMPAIGPDHSPNSEEKYLVIVQFDPEARSVNNSVVVTITGGGIADSDRGPFIVKHSPFRRTLKVVPGSKITVSGKDEWPGMRRVECLIYKVNTTLDTPQISHLSLYAPGTVRCSTN